MTTMVRIYYIKKRLSCKLQVNKPSLAISVLLFGSHFMNFHQYFSFNSSAISLRSGVGGCVLTLPDRPVATYKVVCSFPVHQDKKVTFL